MTNDEITKLVAAELGLQDITAYDETGFIGTWVYQGILDLLARTRCVVRCINLVMFAGVDEYKLEHTILSLVDVENGHRRRGNRADGGHWWTKEAEPPFVMASPWTGQPVVYEDWGNYSFVLVRGDVLLIRPCPSADGKVQVWAVVRPQKMALPTDSLGDDNFGGIPDEFQDAVILYALWKGSSYGDDQSGGQGERYRTQYEGQDGRGGRLAQIRMSVNKRGTGRAPRGRVLMRRGSLSKAAWAG